MERLDRITMDVARMNGEPCIRGLRLTVRRVLEALATYPHRAELKRESQNRGHTKALADWDKGQNKDCPQRCEIRSSGHCGLCWTECWNGSRFHQDRAKGPVSPGAVD